MASPRWPRLLQKLLEGETSNCVLMVCVCFVFQLVPLQAGAGSSDPGPVREGGFHGYGTAGEPVWGFANSAPGSLRWEGCGE